MLTPTIVHVSDSQQELLARLARVAATTAEVLISGPSGVGKELYAAYVHASSPRRDKPFVPINCANFSADMLENEVFGHAKGAFTGAVTGATGIVAAADGGTLFLDEIDSLSLHCQAKILRFAQLREYRRLGEAFVRTSDVRLISATNADLPALVRDGRFREDLYFRLRVVPIAIPPLAEHPEDIPPLLAHFITRYAKEYECQEIRLTQAAEKELRAYSWPGNVRELENCVRYLTCLGLERSVTPDDLDILDEPPTRIHASTARLSETDDDDADRGAEAERDFEGLVDVPLKQAKSWLVEGFERMYIESALRRSRGNVTAAARMSGKHRRAFFQLMRRYGISASTYRGG